MQVVPMRKSAQAVIEKRRKSAEKEISAQKAVSLSNLYEQLSAGKVKELGIILKTDVQGSVEPIRNSLEKLSNDEIKVSMLHAGTGNITRVIYC